MYASEGRYVHPFLFHSPFSVLAFHRITVNVFAIPNLWVE